MPVQHAPARLGAPARQKALVHGAGGRSCQQTVLRAAILPQGGALRQGTADGQAVVRKEVAVLGGEDFIYSQQSGVSEELFKGSVLGVDADVASVDYRQTELNSLAYLPDGLEPPTRFLERVALHFVRNVLAGQGAFRDPPLVLGIWGHKGAGKTFNLELCLKRMGVKPVCLSAGELEDEWAGEPGRRLRERYAFAAHGRYR